MAELPLELITQIFELKKDVMFRQIVEDMKKCGPTNIKPHSKNQDTCLLYCSFKKIDNYIHHYIGASNRDEDVIWLKSGLFFNHGEAFELIQKCKKEAIVPTSVIYNNSKIDHVSYHQIVCSASPKPYEDNVVIYVYADTKVIKDKLKIAATNNQRILNIIQNGFAKELLENIFISKYKESGDLKRKSLSKNNQNIQIQLFFEHMSPTKWLEIISNDLHKEISVDNTPRSPFLLKEGVLVFEVTKDSLKSCNFTENRSTKITTRSKIFLSDSEFEEYVEDLFKRKGVGIDFDLQKIKEALVLRAFIEENITTYHATFIERASPLQ